MRFIVYQPQKALHDVFDHFLPLRWCRAAVWMRSITAPKNRRRFSVRHGQRLGNPSGRRGKRRALCERQIQNPRRERPLLCAPTAPRRAIALVGGEQHDVSVAHAIEVDQRLVRHCPRMPPGETASSRSAPLPRCRTAPRPRGRAVPASCAQAASEARPRRRYCRSWCGGWPSRRRPARTRAALRLRPPRSPRPPARPAGGPEIAQRGGQRQASASAEKAASEMDSGQVQGRGEVGKGQFRAGIVVRAKDKFRPGKVSADEVERFSIRPFARSSRKITPSLRISALTSSRKAALRARPCAPENRGRILSHRGGHRSILI